MKTKVIHKVQYYETDKMGVTHHSNYVRFMEEARIAFMEDIGFGYDKMEEEGIISPVVSIKCDYKRNTSFPDIIEIEVSVVKATPVRLVIGYHMTVGDITVCTAESTHCFLSPEGNILNISTALPEFWKRISGETN